MVNSTVIAQFILHLWGQSEVFSAPTTFIWFSIRTWALAPALIVSFSIYLILFCLLIIFFGWMIHLHAIKFPFRLVLGSPPPILAIPSNIVLWFIDVPGFKVGLSLNITLLGFPSFSVGTDVGLVTPPFCTVTRTVFFSLT